jgi:hypothetical protein
MNRQNMGKICSKVQHATLEMLHVIEVGAMVFNATLYRSMFYQQQQMIALYLDIQYKKYHLGKPYYMKHSWRSVLDTT